MNDNDHTDQFVDKHRCQAESPVTKIQGLDLFYTNETQRQEGFGRILPKSKGFCCLTRRAPCGENHHRDLPQSVPPL